MSNTMNGAAQAHNTLKGGLVGCGFFGQIQLEAWRRMPEAEIVAAADFDLERARRSAPHAYCSATEMIEREQLDFLDIATRPEAHLELVKLGASKKIPVICQKPMAPSWDEAVAMVEAAERAGARLLIHENWRWQPWYRAARRLIAAGAIGQPLAYTMRMRRHDGDGATPYPHQPYFVEMPRLVIYEMLVHHIDTARFLFGDIVSVYAQCRRINPRIAGEDQAVLLLTHADGLQGVIDGHRFLDPEPDGPAMGDASFDGDAGCIRLLATGDLWRGAEKVWENQARAGYRGDSVRATQQHIIECLKKGAPCESEGRDYLKTVAAVEAAYESIRTGQRVLIPGSAGFQPATPKR